MLGIGVTDARHAFWTILAWLCLLAAAMSLQQVVTEVALQVSPDNAGARIGLHLGFAISVLLLYVGVSWRRATLPQPTAAGAHFLDGLAGYAGVQGASAVVAGGLRGRNTAAHKLYPPSSSSNNNTNSSSSFSLSVLSQQQQQPAAPPPPPPQQPLSSSSYLL